MLRTNLNTDRSGRRPRGPFAHLLGRSEGSQLMEFALGLPFLAVLLVGILDFGAGFHLKQKITNAARDGARIGSSLPGIDKYSSNCAPTGTTGPCTVGAIRNAVVNYLNNIDLDTSMIPTTPTRGTGAAEWVYSSTTTGDAILVIDRDFSFMRPDGTLVRATRVQINYPFVWTFGRVIRLLGGSGYANTFLLSTEAIMENLQP